MMARSDRSDFDDAGRVFVSENLPDVVYKRQPMYPTSYVDTNRCTRLRVGGTNFFPLFQVRREGILF